MDWQIYEENWQPEGNRFMEAICLLICRRINFGAIYHGATVSVLAPVGKRRSAGCVAVQVCICFSLLMVRRAVPNAGRESPCISCLRVSQFFDSSAESYPLIIDAPTKHTLNQRRNVTGWRVKKVRLQEALQKAQGVAELAMLSWLQYAGRRASYVVCCPSSAGDLGQERVFACTNQDHDGGQTLAPP